MYMYFFYSQSFFRLDYQLLFGKWFHTPPTKRHLEGGGGVCYYLFPPTLIQPFLLWEQQNQTQESGRKWKENFLFCKNDAIQVQNFLPKISTSVTKTLFVNIFQVSAVHQGNRLNREFVKKISGSIFLMIISVFLITISLIMYCYCQEKINVYHSCVGPAGTGPL